MKTGNLRSCHGLILVVDDEPTIVAMLTKVLTLEGYQVNKAHNGSEAQTSVAAERPELILLDINMPGLNGFEVCQHFKSHEETAHIPIIFLSASSETEERVKGFKVGAVDFVVKPFQSQELLARVHTHLSNMRMQAEIKHQAVELREANLLLRSEISVRETMALSLMESEEKFRTLAGSAQDAFIMLDDEDRIVFWNRAAEGMFGYCENEILGENFQKRLKPVRPGDGGTDCFASFLAADTDSKTGRVIEMISCRKDGAEFPIELSASAVKLRGKRMSIVVIRDITGRKRTQEAILRSEERLNLALESARFGTWDRDLVTGAVWHSPIHDQIFGYESFESVADWSFERFLGHVVPEDRGPLQEQLAVGRVTGQIKAECRIIRAGDQMLRWISIRGTFHFDTHNKPTRMMGLVADITESKLAEEAQKSLEAQNSLSQKLESVGRLASGVAHEINTPMQFVTDNTQFLRRAMTSLTEVTFAYQALGEAIASGKDPAESLNAARAVEENNELKYLLEEIPRTFDETMSGLQRVTQIIKSLKEFAHPNQSQKQPADLNKAINTTIVVSRHEWKYVAEVVTDFDQDLPMIPLRIDEMNQVLLNLIVNAAHAIGDALKQRGEAKGTITIRTKQAENDVLIDVGDNGTGIPQSAQSHIFEPFFTTKGVGKGTGQGLAIIRTIIKSHDGSISFTTEPGKGTTFHIRLPISVPDKVPA